MTYEDWREMMEAKGHTGFALSRDLYEMTDEARQEGERG